VNIEPDEEETGENKSCPTHPERLTQKLLGLHRLSHLDVSVPDLESDEELPAWRSLKFLNFELCAHSTNLTMDVFPVDEVPWMKQSGMFLPNAKSAKSRSISRERPGNADRIESNI
jgi:hypothetical protein